MEGMRAELERAPVRIGSACERLRRAVLTAGGDAPLGANDGLPGQGEIAV
jgi:hypothetical protein